MLLGNMLFCYFEGGIPRIFISNKKEGFACSS